MDCGEWQDLKNYCCSLDPNYKLEKLDSNIILNELVPDSKEVVFIYKEPLQVTISSDDCKIKTLETHVTEPERTLDGNPLPLPFSMSDLTLGDEVISNGSSTINKGTVKYAPVDLQHARFIISRINMGQLPGTGSLPLYILTPGSDYQRTILMGTARDSTGYVTTLIATITDGYVAGQNKSFVDHLIEYHTKRSHMSPFDLQSTVKSTYLIQGTQASSCVELHLTWDTPTMEVPVSEASTDLHLTCKLNSDVSQELWKDLQRLVTFTHLIKAWKLASSQDVSFERINAVLNPQCQKTESNTEDLLSRIATTAEEDKHTYNVAETRWKKSAGSATSAGATRTTGDVFDVSLAQVTSQVMRGERSTLDLSDKLWIILSECHTYRDLSSCFQLVFQKIRANIQEGCKVNILGKKSARFVCAVRNLIKGDNSNPEYWDKLELLVEMGIEKLKNDYSYVFLKANLVYEDQLLPPSDIPKFSEMSGDDWVSHMQGYLNYLARLHTILSILLQVDDCIKLPHTALSHLTRDTFDKVFPTYEELVNNDCRYSFNCPIQTLSIKKFVTGSKLFSSWSLHLSHENKNRRMSTSSLLTMNPLVIHPVCEQNNKEDSDTTDLSRLSPFQHYTLRTNCVKFGTR